MDPYSRKIIAWEILDTLHLDGIVSCINKVKKNRVLSNPIMIHSDRGSQYVSKDYRDSLGDKFIRSYSRKGNPCDNACTESFHALIKRERLNKYYFKDLMNIRRAVFEYI